jgi:hypothetical protein
VDFFVEKSFAHLETYLITPFTERIYDKMKNKYFRNPKILKALRNADASLRLLYHSSQ